MMATPNSVRTLRALQLPYKHSAEDACAEALGLALQEGGVADSDAVAWAELELTRWIAQRAPSTELSRMVRCVAEAAAQQETQAVRDKYIVLADNYFDLHRDLCDEHGLSFAEATSVLSHSSLVIHLALVEALTAAQIARVLSPKDTRAKFSRQVVSQVLSAARVSPDFNLELMQQLFTADEGQELKSFGDASFDASVREVAVVARRFGLGDEFEEALLALSPTMNELGMHSPFTPYLQILHYQCSIAEFFDHAVVDIYEFRPRGAAANWLFDKYPHSIAGASNPFLNNAKAVEVIDESWVRSKRSAERKGARAIHQVLAMLDALGFSARREVATWVRLWLQKIIRTAREQPLGLPPFLSVEQVRQLLTATATENTSTFGIIEQRTLDAVASIAHPNWRSRGVGDAVNATNVSRAKLGDCEFIDAHQRQIHAYEAHGGVLTNLYIQQHLLSLNKSIAVRADELSSVADLSEWRVTVHFVAHDVAQASETSELIHGLLVQVIPMTFRDVFDGVGATDELLLIDAFRSYVIKPMTERRTPNVARLRLIALAGANA